MSILSALKKKFNAKGNNIEEAIKNIEINNDKDKTNKQPFVVTCDLTNKTMDVSFDDLNQAFKDNRMVHFIGKLNPNTSGGAPHTEYQGIYDGMFFSSHSINNLGITFYDAPLGGQIKGYRAIVTYNSSTLIVSQFSYTLS